MKKFVLWRCVMRKWTSVSLCVVLLLTMILPAASFASAESAWILVDTYYYPIRSEFAPLKDFDGTDQYYVQMSGNTIEMRGYNPETFFKQIMDLHAKYSWTELPKIISANSTVNIRLYQEMYSKLDGNLSVGLSPYIKADSADLGLGTSTASKISPTGKYIDGTELTKMYLGYDGNPNFQKSTYVDLSMKFYDAMALGTKRAIYIGVSGGAPGSVGVRYTYEYKIVLDEDRLVQYGATSFPTGIRLQWQPANGLGYRVYRSTSSTELGISISDFFIESTSVFDVNVKPNTTYYYTIKPVISEANPLQSIEEKVGDVIGYYKVESGSEATDTTGLKSVIVLQINNKLMNVNGESKEIDPGRGTVPMVISGRTMIPITAMIEEMGGTVGWDGSTRKVTISARGKILEMFLDQKTIKIDGKSVEMDVAPVSKNGRTYVPVSFVVNNLNAKVSWINSTKEAVVIYE